MITVKDGKGGTVGKLTLIAAAEAAAVLMAVSSDPSIICKIYAWNRKVQTDSEIS